MSYDLSGRSVAGRTSAVVKQFMTQQWTVGTGRKLDAQPWNSAARAHRRMIKFLDK